MFPINPKKMEGMLKQLGMKQDSIDAEEVIIKCSDKNLVINNPSVTRINFQGNDMFQISGSVEEKDLENPSANEISIDDVKAVMKKTGVSEKKAREALEESDGDLAKAIMDLQ